MGRQPLVSSPAQTTARKHDVPEQQNGFHSTPTGNGSGYPALLKRGPAGGMTGGVDVHGKYAPVQPATPPDEDTIRALVAGLCCGDAAVQQGIVRDYVMPDMDFVHACGTIHGKENYYNFFRAGTVYLDYNLTFHDIIRSEDGKVCVWLDLKLKPRFIPFAARRCIPCVALLHFAKDPADGRTKLAKHVDHHSVSFVFWLGGTWSYQVMSKYLHPVWGWVGVQIGKLFDRLQGVKPLDLTTTSHASSSFSSITAPPPSSPAPGQHDGQQHDQSKHRNIDGEERKPLLGASAHAGANPLLSLVPHAPLEQQVRRVVVPQLQDVQEWSKLGLPGKVAYNTLGLLGLLMGLLLFGLGLLSTGLFLWP